MRQSKGIIAFFRSYFTSLGGLVLLSLILFSAMHLLPGDPAQLRSFGGQQNESSSALIDVSAQEDAIRQRYGLDEPVVMQWANWLKGVASWPPNLGREFQSDQSVFPELMRRLGVTLPLTASALLLAFGLAIPLGFFASMISGSATDRWLSVFLFGLYSLPIFWVGSVLVTAFCHQGWLNWFPLMGLTSDHYESLSLYDRFLDVAWHLTLPLVCLTYGSLAYVVRMTRASVNESRVHPSIRAAQARGLYRHWIGMRYIGRSAALPLITLLGSSLPFLVSGSVVVETLFNLPGMGQYAWQGIMMRDTNITMATTLMAAVLTWIGFRVADWGYARLDPRIRLPESS